MPALPRYGREIDVQLLEDLLSARITGEPKKIGNLEAGAVTHRARHS